MDVTTAVESRRSVRGFLDKRVDPALLRQIIEKANRAPSGGNVQPWSVVVIGGDTMARLKAAMAENIAERRKEEPEYLIYPTELPEPYNSRRFGVGEELYRHLGITRDDKQGRARWFAENYEFFNAPIGLFVHMPRFMGLPQWADMGIWLQSLMLLLREAGLDSCPQESWAAWPQTVRRHLPIPEDHWLYTGMSIGYADPDRPVNRTRAQRAPVEETALFLDVD